ncbi:hypothetical protein ACFSVK_19805 [Azorhizophilus paspali]|uniref:hypothetical protein n=1 Tax=Azorhizophilus paspali TaxID=69963 RepID=UPI00362E6EC4
MGGLRVIPTRPPKPLPGRIECIEISCKGRSALFPAHLVVTGDRELRLSFDPLDVDQRRELVRIIMGRADAWLPEASKRTDRPLRSFWSLLKNALMLLSIGRQQKKMRLQRMARKLRMRKPARQCRTPSCCFSCASSVS